MIRLALLCWVISVSGASALAKLEPVLWDDLQARSSLVVLAVAEKLAVEGASASGVASLRVSRVLRGQCETTRLDIRWTAEEHDQRIDRLNSEYLLFLHRVDGKLEGAAYGRSYWPIEYSRDGEPVVVYRYPITMVTMPADLRRETTMVIWRSPFDPQEYKAEVIAVERLLRWLKSAK